MNRRSHLPTRCLLALGALAALSALPSAAIPGDGVVGLASGDQSAPAIATGGGVSLIVWSDGRANPYELYEYETSSDIWGARVNAAGELLDPVPIGITQAKAAQGSPKVAWNGIHWLVVFESTTLAAPATTTRTPLPRCGWQRPARS